MLPDVEIWCNVLVCGNHTQQILHHMTSPLVSVLFVPSIHLYCFCRKFLLFSSFCTFYESMLIAFIRIPYLGQLLIGHNSLASVNILCHSLKYSRVNYPTAEVPGV